MRNDLSLGRNRVTGMANPQVDQDGVNLRERFKNRKCMFLEQATDPFNTAVNDAIHKHGIAVENAVAEAAGIFRGGPSQNISWNQHKLTDLANENSDGDTK